MKKRCVFVTTLLVALLVIISCGVPQETTSRDAFVPTTLSNVADAGVVENTPQSSTSTVPTWQLRYPYLKTSIHLMTVEAKNLKGILGEPAGEGTPSNSGARYLGETDKVHDSLLYSWELPTKKEYEQATRATPNMDIRSVTVRVAIGNTSKRVEAVKVDWFAYPKETILMVSDLLREMGIDETDVKIYFEHVFQNTYTITCVYVKDGISTIFYGHYDGELIVTERETDLETGKSKTSEYRSSKFSLDKIHATHIYVGPARLDPFDHFGYGPLAELPLLPSLKGDGHL